jgi:hypothetical protein
MSRPAEPDDDTERGATLIGNFDALAAFARETTREEYFQLATGTRGLLQTHERILVAGGTLLATITGLAVAQHAYAVLLALPLIIGVLSLFAMRSMVEILALGAYRRAMEDAIAATTGVPTVMWETTIVPTFNTTYAVRGMHAVYAVGYVAGLIGAGFVLRAVHATVLGYLGYGALAFCLSTVLALSVMAVSHVDTRAYAAASAGLARLRELYKAPQAHSDSSRRRS